MGSSLGRVLAVAALVLTAVACSRGERADPERRASPSRAGDEPPVARHAGPPPTEAELRWIGDLEKWYDDQAGFSTLADCGRTLSRDVERAPSPRLRRFRASAERVCELYETANRDERRALSTGDADLGAQASREFREAGSAMTRLRRAFDAFRPNHNRLLPVSSGPSPRSRVDRFLSTLATKLVRRPAEVRCWSNAEWRRLETAMDVGAFVGSEGRRAHLAARDCNRVIRFARSPRLPGEPGARFQLALALTILSHEVGHLGGNYDEALTASNAMQQTRGLARRLGGTEAAAGVLVTTYWKQAYPFLPEEYRSPECRDGGQMDLHPATSRWP